MQEAAAPRMPPGRPGGSGAGRARETLREGKTPSDGRKWAGKGGRGRDNGIPDGRAPGRSSGRHLPHLRHRPVPRRAGGTVRGSSSAETASTPSSSSSSTPQSGEPPSRTPRCFLPTRDAPASIIPAPPQPRRGPPRSPLPTNPPAEQLEGVGGLRGEGSGGDRALPPP